MLSGAVLGLAHWKVAPNNIVLIANFTEAGTGIVETTTSRTVVVHQALKLEFLPYTPKYFKLGLPYHGKVKFTRNCLYFILNFNSFYKQFYLERNIYVFEYIPVTRLATR